MILVLHNGALAEVSTGEGKTLVATLPVALNAMQGQGVHVTTVNDYLAQRDADWTSRIYTGIGLTVGCLQQRMTDDTRKAAYNADITYGTASEFGFDFLRDRLKTKGGYGQERPLLDRLVQQRSGQQGARSEGPARPSLRPGR